MTTLEFERARATRHRRRGSLPALLPGTAPEGGRRLLNVAVAAVALPLVAPLMIAIAALIKLTSTGPVLYTQTRVGLDRRTGSAPGGNWRRSQDVGGAPFTMLKFRTMHVDQNGHGTAQVWAQPGDPRITWVGRFLRKFRLDELPQFVNVLRGEMNIVGPRPEQPAIFADLRQRVDGYQQRQRVRPGITGWAQINQSYDRSLDDVRRKVGLDLEYVARQSVSHDLQIMLRTVPVMLLRKGGW